MVPLIREGAWIRLVEHQQVERDNTALEQTVQQRTGELLGANQRLVQEIAVRTAAEQSLQRAYSEIEELKNRFQAESVYLQQDIDREFNFGETCPIVRESRLVCVLCKFVCELP